MEWHFLGKVFQILCLVATGWLIYIDSLKFFKNEDRSLVEYRTFHDTKKDIYPSISICFYGPGIYDCKKLNETYGVEHAEEYMKFLKGDVWEDRMVGVKYDEVTLDVEDRIESIVVWGMHFKVLYGWAKINENTENLVKYLHSVYNFTNSFPLQTTYRLAEGKCFSLDLTVENLPHIEGQLINSVGIGFRNIGIPGVAIQYMLSYPGQILRGFVIDSEVTWNLQITSGHIKNKFFLIDIIDVFRKRDKADEPCNANWDQMKQSDQKIMHDIIEMADCTPPHWNISTDYPICNSKDKMKNATIETSPFKHASPSFLKAFEQPCDGIQAATLNSLLEPRKNLSSFHSDNGSDSASVTFHFKNERYKEIKYTKAFDLPSLVGEVGGYIGLLLGFAFWQFPGFIKLLNVKLSTWVEGNIHNT